MKFVDLHASALGYASAVAVPVCQVLEIRNNDDGEHTLPLRIFSCVHPVFAAFTAEIRGRDPTRKCVCRGENHGDLSSRESEVLKLIAFGYSNKEIATRLNLSVKTVEAHKANAMRKLGIASRIDIVKYAILQNWLQDD